MLNNGLEDIKGIIKLLKLYVRGIIVNDLYHPLRDD